MLQEEFLTIARRLLADYKKLGVEENAQLVINALRNRSAQNPGAYINEAQGIRDKIAAAIVNHNAYLDSPRVKRLFERSDYAGMLPKDVLNSIALLVPDEFNFAASSSEAEALLSRIKNTRADFLSSAHTANRLKVKSIEVENGSVLLDLVVPEAVTERSLAKTADLMEQFDKFFAYSSEYLVGSPTKPTVIHMSGSMLVLFLEFAGPSALIIIKIWNELMKAAKSTLEAKTAILNFKRMGADEKNSNAMLDQMTDKVYERLREDLERFAKLPSDKISEGRRQEIYQIFHTQITYVVEKIELGVRLELEDNGDRTLKVLTESDEPDRLEETRKLLIDKQVIQAQVSQALEQQETKLIAPPVTP